MARKDHLDGLAVGLLLGCSLLWGFQQALAGATALLWLWCQWRGIALVTLKPAAKLPAA